MERTAASGASLTPTMDEQSRLVDSAKSGDKEAFGRLLQMEVGWAFGVAVAVCGSREEAEDAFQEASLKAWLELRRLRQVDLWQSWFRKIVINEAIDISRRTARTRRAVAIAPTQGDGDPGRVIPESDAVGAVLKKLSADERAILVLRYGRDMQVDEVAAMLGIRLGTAKSRLSRTLAKCRRLVGAEDTI